MKILKYFLLALSFAVGSCTLERTDYEAETAGTVVPFTEFKEVSSFSSGNYKVIIEALNGTFYKGYNEVRVKIKNNTNGQFLQSSNVTFLPAYSDANGKLSSCPNQYELQYNAEKQSFTGYSVFDKFSDAAGKWILHISFTADGQTFNNQNIITVQEQSNKNLNMAAFQGNDGKNYIIALISPQKPTVSENILTAGIYKNLKPQNSGNIDDLKASYSKVQGYTLQIDPRMPEPSMGNHSSPNNKDLTQQSDGNYQGVVNYTMTGNWTLNFILVDNAGKIVKGTVVPKDFTPGVEGAKSELFIDILF